MSHEWEPRSNVEVKDAVRAETQYEDSERELPEQDLNSILERAKHRVSLETDSTNWYSDSGIGMVLIAYTCMRAKAAVENAFVQSYSLGDQQVTVRNADPETSQQIQQWAEDVRVGLNASSLDAEQGPTPTNTADYIGETYYEPAEHHK